MGFWGGDVLVWLSASAYLLSVLCTVSGGLSYPDVDRQELGSTSLALIIPCSAPVEGRMLSFAFQNLYLPASSLNKSQLHLCPKPQVACLSLGLLSCLGWGETSPLNVTFSICK